MRRSAEIARRPDSSVLLFLFALFVLVSPFLLFWVTDRTPWYVPYLVWLGLIVLAAWANRGERDHDV